MASAKVTHQSGNRLIVLHNDDPEDSPTVLTPEEAEDIKNDLQNIL